MKTFQANGIGSQRQQPALTQEIQTTIIIYGKIGKQIQIN
jgi:hypothetical protein